VSKFNKPKTIHQILSEQPDATKNEEDGLAFEPSTHQEFYQLVATWMVSEPKFYDQNDETSTRIRWLVGCLSGHDPEFVLKMAAYARNELYLRSGPSFILALACKHDETRQFVSSYTDAIVRRADEVTEVLAAYSKLNIKDKKKVNIPRALRTGLKTAVKKFDEYQLAKYDRKGEWSLRDAFRVIRPKPTTDEQRELWGRLVKGELKTPDTWEVKLSTEGASKETWDAIVPKMGYMALLRNLRNFLKHKVDLDPVIARLVDPEEVRRSKQFPFRFYSAHTAISGRPNIISYGPQWGGRGFGGFEQNKPSEFVGTFEANRVLAAIETALKLSVDNVPVLKGRTFVACDNSGSMTVPVSGKSNVNCMEIGNLMGSLAGGFCEDVMVAAFGSNVVPVNFRKTASVFDNMRELNDADNGGATYGWKIPAFLMDGELKDVDRIIVFTDMQMYDQRYHHLMCAFGDAPKHSFADGITKYRRAVGHPVRVYLFNLQGYGTLQTPEDDQHTYNISGWSDRVFEWINYIEQDPTIILKTIKEYKYERPERKEKEEERQSV